MKVENICFSVDVCELIQISRDPSKSEWLDEMVQLLLLYESDYTETMKEKYESSNHEQACAGNRQEYSRIWPPPSPIISSFDIRAVQFSGSSNLT